MSLGKRIETLEHRVGRLQALQPEVSWRRNPATIIALCALVFSISTTAFSYYQAHLAAQRARYAEFRMVLNELTNVPLQFLPAEDSARQSRRKSAYVDGVRRVRETFLTDQAIAYLESPNNLATAAEYLEVGRALSGPGSFKWKQRLYSAALERADSSEQKIIAYRRLAVLGFDLKNVDSGRAYYEKALAVPAASGANEIHPMEAAFTTATTEIYWANDELLIGQCARAKERAMNAKRVLRDVTEGLGGSTRQDLKAIFRRLARCGEPRPSGDAREMPAE